jgi:ABC-2 type transport system ATP-binding protein
VEIKNPEWTASAVVDVRNLHKRYGAREALAGVSFTIGSGEMVGLLGPNGAGKTTLIGCLLGFLLPSAGEVRLFGNETIELRPSTLRRIGFVPQAMNGFTWFKVGELIEYLGQFYAHSPGPVPTWLLEWAALDMKQRVKALSGGQKQRLAILLAMRHEPDFLVLDEPVASLDPQARLDFIALIARFCADCGRSALVSSHILSDLEKIVTRAIFMRRGLIVHDTSMQRFRTAMRWVRAPRDVLPVELSVLVDDRGNGEVLVDGWSDSVADIVTQRLGTPVSSRQPDLEAAFLEMTR